MPDEKVGISLGSFIDTKDILKLVVGKISSQILLYSIAIIILILVAYSIWGKDGLIPTILIVLIFFVGAFGYLFKEQKQKADSGDPQVMNKILDTKMKSISNTNTNGQGSGSKLKIELGIDKATIKEGSRDINYIPTSSGDEFRVGDKIKYLILKFQNLLI